MKYANNSLQVIHSALSIKNWICINTSPFIWSSVIAQALPEMLEINPHFSASDINKKTKWCKNEAEVVRNHLRSMYEIDLPTEVLYENADIKYESFGTSSNKGLSSLRKLIGLGGSRGSLA